MDQLLAGSVLAGRYRLAGLAGASRTLSPGTVWRAVDEVARLEIAVKILDDKEDGDPGSYAAAGVPLSYIGPENEANLSTSYDSMQLSPSQTANVLDVLGPTLASSGLSTKMECCAAEGWDFASQYASAIEADPTALADTAVFASHG